VIDWSDALVLGFPAMDNAHRTFVADLKALCAAADDGLASALDVFAVNLAVHFAQEEGWMRDTDFPAAQCHADEHAAVSKSIAEVRAVLADEEQGADRFALVRELAAELARWFPAHTDYLDAALSQWISKRAHGGVPVVLRRGAAQAGAEPAPKKGHGA
jgi:hemerythrin